MALSDVLSKINGGLQLAGGIANGIKNPNSIQPGSLGQDFNQMRYGPFGMPMVNAKSMSKKAMSTGFGKNPMQGSGSAGFNSIAPPTGDFSTMNPKSRGAF